MTTAINKKRKGKRIIIIVLKTVLWIVAVPVVLLVIIVIALQFPKTQTFVAGKATAFLSKKTHTKVQLNSLSIDFPKTISISGLYLEDEKKDTLFYGKSIRVDLNLWDLLSKKIALNSVELETITGHIYRNAAGGKFNFSFIPDAFASKEPIKKTVADTSAGWQFSIKNISLKQIYFTYHDRSSGMNADLHLGEFKTGFDAFDLDKQIIHVAATSLKNTQASVLQNEPLQKTVDTTGTAPFNYDIALRTIALDTLHVSYTDKTTGQDVNVSLGQFLLDVKKIDLTKKKIDLAELMLHHTELSYTQHKINDQKLILKTEAASTSNAADWVLTLKKLDLDNNTVAYNDDTKPAVKNTLDFSHLLAKHISIQGKDIYANAKNTKLQIDNLSFAEQSGFVLKKLQTKLVFDSTHADLSNLLLQTNNSTIKDHLGIRYSSLAALKDSIQSLGVTTSFNNTTLSIKDALYFVPDLFKKVPLKENKNLMIGLSGNISGTLKDLKLSKVELKTQATTFVKVNGSVKNITDPKALYASATFEVNSTKKDLTVLVVDSLIPKSVSIPESFNVKGSYTGYLKNFDADVALNSSIGAVTANVKMNPKAGNKEQPYEGKIDVNNFDLGKLLNQSKTLGVITMTAGAKGSGFDTSNINVKLSAGIQKAVFKNYPYSNFQLDGSLVKKSFTGKAAMNDNNLAFTFNGGVDMEPAHPKYTFTLDLSGADFKALNLSDEDLRISALIQSDIGNDPGKNATGKASIKNALIIKNNHKYPLDSLVLTSTYTNNISDISLRSEILTADFNGDITVKQLPDALKEHINTYFNLQEPAIAKTNLNKQKFKFEVKLVDPSLLIGNLVPKLEKLTPFAISGSYDSEAKDLEVNANVPQIKYSGITVDSLKLDINSNTEKLNYDLKITEVSNPTLKFENLFLGGDLKNNSLGFQFNTAKDDSAKLLAIGGILKSINKEFELKLNPDLIINTEKWTIDNANTVNFSKQGLYASDVVLSNNLQSISLNSKEKSPAAPLEITFKSFDIATISRLIENKKDLVNGIINGTIVLEKQNGVSAFKSDIELKDFAFKKVPVGTIKVKADNFENPQKYDVDLSVEGGGNDITMKGFYSAGKNNDLNFTLNVNNLNLASVQPFTFNQVTRMSGAVNGKMTVKGPVSLPVLDGSLHFKDAALRPKLIGTYLTIPDSKITFDGRKIRFNNFVLNDTLKHTASVDGLADLNDFKTINLDLRVKTDDFLAMNTTKKHNPLYYGTVILDSDIRVKGTTDAPTIDAKIKLNKGTTLTYIKPENEISKNESKGIVVFENNTGKNIAIMARQNDSINGITNTKGIDLHASIDVNNSVVLKMIVDPNSGDSLYIQGGGLLDFNLDRSGKTNLSGKYRINDGGYYLALEGLVKRSFKIQKGSSVSWSGDVLDAYVDMTAIYTIKTSPLDLVSDELSGVNDLERNKYRNALTFLVYLKMTGFISTPEISFDIQLAPEDRGALNGAVNGKLAELREDESQLNKQVFALLTLRRFIGENPLESSSDGGLSSASRSSASQVLTQQLSSLSSKYINFVDLDLGVNSFEDYSSGSEQGRTQLQVGVSKQLFNDKITVRVGGNVDLEGERATQNDVNDVAGNVSVDYKLTPDGRYKLKGFRENNYENAIEGELTKTGAGVVYVRNFNTFKQLFSKPPKPPVKQKETSEDKNNDDDDK